MPEIKGLQQGIRAEGAEQGVASSWNTLLLVRTSQTGHRGERGGNKLGLQEVERQGKGRRGHCSGQKGLLDEADSDRMAGLGDAPCSFQLPPWDQ